KVLLILSANPVFTAPADLDFAAKMAKVPLRVRLGLYDDETAALCHWHIPEAHFLESWSDATGPDGTASIVQPLIAPVDEGKTAHEVTGAFVNIARANPASDAKATPEAVNWREWRGREIVRDHWRRRHRDRGRSEPFEAFWRKAVHDGVVPGSAPEPRT